MTYNRRSKKGALKCKCIVNKCKCRDSARYITYMINNTTYQCIVLLWLVVLLVSEVCKSCRRTVWVSFINSPFYWVLLFIWVKGVEVLRVAFAFDLEGRIKVLDRVMRMNICENIIENKIKITHFY